MNIDFEVFNNKTLPTFYTKELNDQPTITIREDGVMAFNRLATELLQLKDGVLIGLNRDPKHKDWYVKVNDPNGYPVRSVNRSKKAIPDQFKIGHKELAGKIRSDIGGAHTLVIPVSETPMADLYQLDTRQMKERAARPTPATVKANKKK